MTHSPAISIAETVSRQSSLAHFIDRLTDKLTVNSQYVKTCLSNFEQTFSLAAIGLHVYV